MAKLAAVSGNVTAAIEWNDDALDLFDRLGDKKTQLRVLRRAVQRGTKAGQVKASRLVRSRYAKIKASQVKERMTIALSQRSGDILDIQGSVRVAVNYAVPLIAFQTGKFDLKNPPKVGVRVKVLKGGKSSRVPGAFVQTINTRLGVWRKQKGNDGRYPVRHLYTRGPFRYLIAKKPAEEIIDRMNEILQSEFQAYSKYILDNRKPS